MDTDNILSSVQQIDHYTSVRLLMISPPASTISLQVCLVCFQFQCLAAGMINGTPLKYQLSRFAREKSCIYQLVAG